MPSLVGLKHGSLNNFRVRVRSEVSQSPGGYEKRLDWLGQATEHRDQALTPRAGHTTIGTHEWTTCRVNAVCAVNSR